MPPDLRLTTAASTASRPKAILLMGPTASGKTAAALELARRFPVELISVDLAQVFVDMNVGTAKPDAATLAAFPHHLIDLITPEEAYSAARFRQDALACMADIVQRGRIPLLVGGTMLYYKALLEGLAELPAADPATRAEIDALAVAGAGRRCMPNWRASIRKPLGACTRPTASGYSGRSRFTA